MILEDIPRDRQLLELQSMAQLGRARGHGRRRVSALKPPHVSRQPQSKTRLQTGIA